MKKQTAIALAGSAKALSDLLGINQSAISQWGDLIPELRMWQLKSLKPEWFDRLADKSPVVQAAPVNALRAGRVRRLTERRAQSQRAEHERRAKVGTPYQVGVTGVA